MPARCAAVAAVDVLDHLLAALVLEVDVDVGRLVARLGDEALEDHGADLGADRGDAEGEADHRVRRRAAALAEDALGAGEIDHVADGEEVGRVVQPADQRELVRGLGRGLRRAPRTGSAISGPSRSAAPAGPAGPRRPRSRAGTRSAARRGGSGSPRRSRPRGAPPPRGRRRAAASRPPSAAAARRWRARRGRCASMRRPSRMQVSTSTSRRREPWCMIGSAEATSGRPRSAASRGGAGEARRSPGRRSAGSPAGGRAGGGGRWRGPAAASRAGRGRAAGAGAGGGRASSVRSSGWSRQAPLAARRAPSGEQPAEPAPAGAVARQRGELGAFGEAEPGGGQQARAPRRRRRGRSRAAPGGRGRGRRPSCGRRWRRRAGRARCARSAYSCGWLPPVRKVKFEVIESSAKAMAARLQARGAKAQTSAIALISFGSGFRFRRRGAKTPAAGNLWRPAAIASRGCPIRTGVL